MLVPNCMQASIAIYTPSKFKPTSPIEACNYELTLYALDKQFEFRLFHFACRNVDMGPFGLNPKDLIYYKKIFFIF